MAARKAKASAPAGGAPDLSGLSPDEAAGVRRALKAGQGSTLRFWDKLDLAGRQRLAAQLAGIDYDLVKRLIAEHVSGSGAAAAKAPAGKLEPSPVDRLPASEDERRAEERFREAGEDAIRAGRVAALTVAGGQGTRLGYDGPKGCYVFGPVTGRTLFRHHAEKILAVSRRCGRTIPWLVMTSDANFEVTRDYLVRERFFGVDPAAVHIFQQGMLPASDRAGQLILEAADRLAMSPNGHGGTIQALSDAGLLDKLAAQGVDTISYFQVDNPLVRAVDPVFIGRHIAASSEMSIKVLKKCGPLEKVGVAVTRGGRIEVIEYSDLPDELAHARDAKGELLYWAGSIAIHVFSVPFLARLAGEAKRGGGLPYHRAEKAVPCADAEGKTAKPDGKNGIKFECFIFDALPLARKGLVVETRREEEFAPIKNATGEDSAESCRKMLADEWARWIEAAGGEVPRRADGTVDGRIEVSPLYALDAAELAAKLPAGFRMKPGSDVVLA
ncbi:MAG TPA: UDPGP type 1 family protein [Planctomycetota bacterium]|nr:UDPGP type 1 family protein [Planctomycetota bacterium]